MHNKPEEMLIHEKAADIWNPLPKNTMKKNALEETGEAVGGGIMVLCSVDS